MQILLELPWWPKDTPWAFVAWSPSPHEIHCFGWLDGEKPFRTIRLFQSCASACRTPINVWNLETMWRSSFLWKFRQTVHAGCTNFATAHGSWLKPCTGCEFSAARWLALCHWVQTFTATSSDHICEPNAEILAAAPQLGFDMFLFGGWWKLAELFGRHFQYIFKFQDVSSRFGAHQGTRELPEWKRLELARIARIVND